MLKSSRIATAFLLSILWSNAARSAEGQEAKAPNECDSPMTTDRMNECSYAQFQKSDGELNSLYRKILPLLPTEQQGELRNAQRFWLRFRDADCKAEFNRWNGGSGGLSAQNYCLEERTKQRIDSLKPVYDSLKD